MKSLVALTCSIITDAAHLYNLDPARDIETVTRRHCEEGEPFLTITLDAFRVAFEAALEAGAWVTAPPGFRMNGGLPGFLRGFLTYVFQRDGNIRRNPDWRAVALIRQITGLSAKMSVECKPVYTARALASYIEVDDRAVTGADPALKAVFASLFDPVCKDVSDDIIHRRLAVRHGNGASQDRLRPNSRWNLAHWEERLEALFPSWWYTRVNDADLAHRGYPAYVSETTPVRVAFVPKTAKGPRTIAVEPSWRMYIQQGLMDSLVKSLERRGSPCYFSSVALHHERARIGSENREWATIDLSSASDSVSLRLVSDLFGGRPVLRDGLISSRSMSALLPDGTTRVLNKFASMGSATCFPVESMVFAAIAVRAMVPELESGFPDLSCVREVSHEVIVFGDDIIVPSSMYTRVVEALALYGFSVNRKKSFFKGSFRESCGGDFFAGHDVSYVKVRQPLGYSTRTAKEAVSTVSLRNQLAAKGFYPRTVEALDRALLSGLKVFPWGTEDSAGLVRVSGPASEPIAPSIHRWDRALQRGLQKGWRVVAEPPQDVLDGHGALHKALSVYEHTRDHSDLILDWDTAGRSQRVRLTAGWLPVG